MTRRHLVSGDFARLQNLVIVTKDVREGMTRAKADSQQASRLLDLKRYLAWKQARVVVGSCCGRGAPAATLHDPRTTTHEQRPTNLASVV